MKKLSYAFIVLLLSTVVAVMGWLLYSSSAVYWVVNKAVSGGDSSLQVGKVEGELAGPLQLFDVRYTLPGFTVTIESLYMDWQPSQLMAMRLGFKTIEATGISIVAKSGSEQQQEFSGVNTPFPITITQMILKKIHFQGVQDEDISIDSVMFAGRWFGSRIDVDRLQVMAPWGELNSQGVVASHPEQMLDFKLQWRLKNESLPDVMQGDSHLSGTLTALTMQHQLNAPVELNLNGELLDMTSWSLQARVLQFNPNDLRGEWPDLLLSGDLKGSGDFQQWSSRAVINIASRESGAWQLAFQGEGNRRQWHFSTLELNQQGGDGHFSGQGAVMFTEPVQANLKGKWRSLGWPLLGEQKITSEEGVAVFSGTLEEFRLQMESELTFYGTPSSRWQFTGVGNQGGLKSDSLEITWLAGHWQGKGELDWRQQFLWSLRVKGDGIDPASEWQAWPGNLSATLYCSKDIKGDQSNIILGLDNVLGEVRERQVSGSGQITFTDQGLAVDHLSAKVASATVEVDGLYEDQMDLRWKITAPQLMDLLPGWQGSVHGSGSWKGLRNQPTINAQLEGRNLQRQDLQVAALMAKVSIHDQPGRAGFSVTGNGFSQAGQLLVRDFGVQGEGERLSEGWQLSLKKGAVNPATGAPWLLHDEASWFVVADKAQFSTLCWQQQESVLCAQGEMSALDTWSASLSFQEFKLLSLSHWLPKGIRLEGTASGSVEVAMADGDWRKMRVEMLSKGGTLSYPLKGDQWHATVYQSLHAGINYDDEGLLGQFDLVLSQQNSINAEGRLVNWRLFTPIHDQQKVAGELRVSVHDLMLLPLFVPDLAEPEGNLKLGVSLSGSVGNPRWLGQVNLDNGQVALPRLGLTLNNVSLQGDIRDGSTLVFKGGISSGEGRVTVDGHLTADSLTTWQGALNLKGERFELLRLPEVKLLVSPEIDLLLQPRSIRIDGKLLIPYARVEYGELVMGSPISSDVVIIDQGPQEEKRPWDIVSHVRLVLGENIRIKGYGFEGKLGGQLALINEPPLPLSIWGDVNIETGRYRAYGQNLSIELGRIMFAGSALDNPGIDMRAVRIKGDIKAGVHVTGRLNKPVLTLFSQPPMDQTDVLSYIVLGQPLSMSKEKDGDALYRAASSVGLAGGEMLSQRIGNRFGIEEVMIESGTHTEDAQLVVGKQVSTRLYVRYGYGLWSNLNSLLARYRLSRRWSLETQAGAESSADFKFSIEK